MSFVVAIPARYGATRLPGKVLREIAGEPLLAHVHRRALESGADEVWVATDDDRIEAAAVGFGARTARTSAACASGSDRIAELAAREAWPDDLAIVNLQGDEPLMPGALIRQVAEALIARPGADIATACTPIEELADYRDPNVVKVVRDDAGDALYFSRAPIPHQRGGGNGLPAGGAWRHLGIYAYRAAALKRFAAAPPAALERCESLEQLRALALGMRIHVVEAAALPGPGVDTEEDLAAVAALLRRG
ncbi:3-deoxy-D-manno-octulosonate cytidylyltransferase [Salinisphaera sp. PC39]|uniref:3-deoxy-manno-octulosonate cytidylyltransferase n=1 Tax=Salinisphaera sp. PC39 TaxID=1304156 RepID=UPI00333E3FC0